MWLVEHGMADPENAGAAAMDYLYILGHVAMGAIWTEMAKVAKTALANGHAGDAFYQEQARHRALLHEAHDARYREPSRQTQIRRGARHGARRRRFLTPSRRRDTPTMADAFIYDAVRTPRGKGRVDGALHDITPIQLATQVLKGIRDRNELDTDLVDDVILGCVSPVGEQGSDIARVAALNADYDEDVPGVQVNRFCASGLEAVNMAAGQVMAGQADLMVAGGVESMSRVKMGSDGGAMATDPQVAFKTYFVPQGISADLIATKYGYSRDDVDAFAVESQKRTKSGVGRRPLFEVDPAGEGQSRPDGPGQGRASARRDGYAVAGTPEGRLRRYGRGLWLRCRGAAEISRI